MSGSFKTAPIYGDDQSKMGGMVGKEIVALETDRSGSCLFAYLSNIELLAQQWKALTYEDALVQFGKRIFVKRDDPKVQKRSVTQFPKAALASWPDPVYNERAKDSPVLPYSFLVFAQTGGKPHAEQFAQLLEQYKLGQVVRSAPGGNIIYCGRAKDADKVYVWQVDYEAFQDWYEERLKTPAETAAPASERAAEGGSLPLSI